MNNVVKLPTASPTRVEVRRAGKAWAVQLVTPVDGGKPIRTTISRSNNFDMASNYAKGVGNDIKRPVRLP